MKKEVGKKQRTLQSNFLKFLFDGAEGFNDFFLFVRNFDDGEIKCCDKEFFSRVDCVEDV